VGALLTAVGDDDGNDEAVDAEHTSHDNGDDRLHDQVRLHHTHRRHADPRLGSSVRSAEVCQAGWVGVESRVGHAALRRCSVLRPARRRKPADRRARARPLHGRKQGAHALAKISATAAPMKPKKGAVGGHSSSNGIVSENLRGQDR